MFSGCSALKNITIPATVANIQGSAFLDSGITNVTFADRTSKLTFAGNGEFKNCLSLTSFVFPEKSDLGTINATATKNIFEGCVNLTSVEFKNVMTGVPGNIFLGCEKLTTVKFTNTPENVTGIYVPAGMLVGKNAFDGVGEGATITFETNYYNTLGVWNAAWYAGCKATIVMDGITMNPYLF